MIALRPRDRHVWDPRPVPHETEAETKTNTLRPRPRLRSKSGLETTLVSRP